LSDRVIEITLDEYGTVVRPNLHDGFVHGIMLQKDDSVRIHMSNESQDEYVTMNCLGLDTLFVTNFREGNILFDIRIRKAKDISKSELKKIIVEMYGHGDFRLCRRLRSSALKVVEICPSYGCTVIVVCEKILFLNGV